MKHVSLCTVVCVIVLLALHSAAVAGELKPIELPAPQTEGGKPLMEALKLRHSERAFSEKEIPLQVLSNMLWAAFGVNRPESGKRTAPSARNWQEIDIYVTMAKGTFRYNASANTLEPVLERDIRGETGQQPFVAGAPVNLVYVADYSKMGDAPEEAKQMYSAADTGFISQNVYLFCASEGLATVVRGLVERNALEDILMLGSNKKVVFAQTVGYPAE
jgi:SagB-type dehydrogenase family enzyme